MHFGKKIPKEYNKIEYFGENKQLITRAGSDDNIFAHKTRMQMDKI